MVLPKILTSLSEDKSKVSPDGGGRGTEERSRRSFSRTFKSVLLKNPLVSFSDSYLLVLSRVGQLYYETIFKADSLSFSRRK